jgi:hypothetical protein
MMATKVAKVIFGLCGVLLLSAALLPALRGQPVNTGSLSTAGIFFVLALALRPRRRQPPPGPGA